VDSIRGDELVVAKLDRSGRNTRDILNLVHELDQKGAGHGRCPRRDRMYRTPACSIAGAKLSTLSVRIPSTPAPLCLGWRGAVRILRR